MISWMMISTARHLLQEEDPANDIQSITMESLMDGDTSVQANSEGSLTSVGSRQHHLGRCKPRAFFHTKGCKSASGCLFCHLCPPNEKQRRKALYRRMCQKFQPVMAVAAQRWGNQKVTIWTIQHQSLLELVALLLDVGIARMWNWYHHGTRSLLGHIDCPSLTLVRLWGPPPFPNHTLRCLHHMGLDRCRCRLRLPLMVMGTNSGRPLLR